MSKYTPQQLREIYLKLPEDVKEAMFSVDTAEIIRNIGEKHKLMIDKIGELADETGLVMLGLAHPSEFISHLADRLGVEKEKAKEIAEETNSKVFFPIRENLKKIHGVEEAAPEGGEPRPEISGRETPTVITPEIPPIMPAALGPTAPEAPLTPLIPMGETPPAPTPTEAPKPTAQSATTEPLTQVAEVAPPPTEPAPPGIFEAKTKEEPFRSPIEVSEKSAEGKKFDPYHEQI